MQAPYTGLPGENTHDGSGNRLRSPDNDRQIRLCLGVTIRWQSNYPGFRDHGIPLVHQLAVAGPFRRLGVATLLMDAAEDLARGRGVAILGITVGILDKYGPAQRLYAQRGGRRCCLVIVAAAGGDSDAGTDSQSAGSISPGPLGGRGMEQRG